MCGFELVGRVDDWLADDLRTSARHHENFLIFICVFILTDAEGEVRSVVRLDTMILSALP